VSFWWVRVVGFLLQRGFLLLLLLRFVCSRKGVSFLVCFHVGHFLFLVVCIEETESMTSAEQLVLELIVPEQRENALLDLSKKREAFPDLAPMLWHSCGTIAALLQEIVSIYPMLSPPTLTAGASNRVCNALALLQCVASHPDTRTLFLNGNHFCAFYWHLLMYDKK
jgi:hypothetical protein